jgi:nitrogen regulation protein NR(I)
MRAKILLVEDDPSTGPALQKVLRAEGYHTDLVPRGDQGLARARQLAYDLVLVDFRLPGLDGLELVRCLHEEKPKLPIILMTAHGTTETAIEATKRGACEYLTKPFEADELLDHIASAVQNSRLMSESVRLGDASSRDASLVGSSRAMQSVYKEIGRIASTPVTVLIRGGTGTGKDLVARAIYHHSDRAERPFIAVNCAAIPQTLMESELFGHERGAFSGAHSRRIGRFEQAHGGTLFLDEIGDLPLETQSKLLRVLQDGQFHRLGSEQPVRVDVRVLAATHRDLNEAMAEREFREDLYFRLSVATIDLPTLEERLEDVPDLVRHFIRRYAHDLRIDEPSIQPEAISFLQRQPWPGNVRELENTVRQALLLARPFAVGLDHVKQALIRLRRPILAAQQTHSTYVSNLLTLAERGEFQDAYWRMIAELEPELFSQAIRRAQGNQAKAARWLGVTRLKMREQLKQLGLLPERDRDKEDSSKPKTQD